MQIGYQGCWPMKRISGLGLAVATIVVLALADGAARAQDFTAGKTPAQLFASDCSACHRGTAGLAKGRDARTLSSFLREHYTTKPESAGALAAYVASGIGANAPLAGAPAGPAATAEPPPTERRGSHDTTTAATEEGGGPKPAEDASARRRRTTNLSGDGEKPRSREGGEPRPPVAGSPEGARDGTRPARTVRGEEANRALRSGERADAPDPVEQLRAYLA